MPFQVAVSGQSWATAYHPYSLEVNGTDLADLLISDSLRIEMAGPGTNGSCSFTLYDGSLAASLSPWDEVVFTEHAAPRPRLFGGFVQTVAYEASEGAGRSVVVECVGYGVLLDKRVVDASGTINLSSIGTAVQSLIGRFGGNMQAAGWTSSEGATYGGSESLTVNCTPQWYYEYQPYAAQSAVSLRSALSAWTEDNIATVPGNTFYYPNGNYWYLPSFPLIWVDSCWRIHLDWSLTSVPGSYENAATFTADGAGGTIKMSAIRREAEDSDKATSAYVYGGTGSGVGWMRTTPLERVGDLEITHSDPDSAAETRRYASGLKALSSVATGGVRGTITAVSETPLDIRPGQQAVVTAAKVGLTGSEGMRVTAVSITWQSPTARTYSVDFGGTLAAPSFANRSGRYATR